MVLDFKNKSTTLTYFLHTKIMTVFNLYGILPIMPLVPGYPCSVPGYPLSVPGYPGPVPACPESVPGCPWFIVSNILSAIYLQLQETKSPRYNDL